MRSETCIVEQLADGELGGKFSNGGREGRKLGILPLAFRLKPHIILAATQVTLQKSCIAGIKGYDNQRIYHSPNR